MDERCGGGDAILTPSHAVLRRYGAPVPAALETNAVSRANGVEFRVPRCGDGPLALCFHGFPDSACTWRHLLAGWPRPATGRWRRSSGAMRLPRYPPTAATNPARWHGRHRAARGARRRRATPCSSVTTGARDGLRRGRARARALAKRRRHGGAARRRARPGFIDEPGQIKRSWYMFFFQHPLADLLVGANDLAFIDRLWATGHPASTPPPSSRSLKPSLRDPANLAAAARLLPGPPRRRHRRTRRSTPSQAGDPGRPAPAAALPPRRRRRLHRRGGRRGGAGDGPRQRHASRSSTAAGHFLHLERPDEVNRRDRGVPAS